MSSIEYDPPSKPFFVHPPSVRGRMEAAAAAANERARFRLAIAERAAHTEGSLAQKQATIKAAIAIGDVPLGRVPCIETIRTLEQRYRAGAQSAADYRDDLRPRGPRRAPVSAALRAVVKRLATQHGTGDLPHLARLVNADPETPTGESITAWRLRAVLDEIGRHVIVAGRQGSRAAEFDTLPRGTYPTRYTHELWQLDEGESEYYMQGICRIRGIEISAVPWVIVTRDHCSGLLLGLHAVDPTRRLDEQLNRSMTTGFDHRDVLAALLSASSPELCASSVREVAGKLPTKVRWDNAKQHKLIERTLFVDGQLRRAAATPDLDADDREEGDDDALLRDDWVGAAVPATALSGIAVRRPDRNGGVERMMRLVKRWSVGLHGHVDEVIPVDRLPEGWDAGRERSMVAVSSRGRMTRLEVVPVRTLPTIEQLQAVFNAVVDRYNTEHSLRRHGMPPIGAARKYWRGRYRSSEDLIRLLEPASYRVQREGIVVTREGRSVAFEAVNNGVLYQPGATVQVYLDPLLRRAWLEQGRYLTPLLPKTERAAQQDATLVAQMAADVARAASDEAAERRAAHLDATFGPGTAAEGQKAYEDARQAGAANARTGDDRVGRGVPNAGASSTHPRSPGASAGGGPHGGGPDAPLTSDDYFNPDALLPPEPEPVDDASAA